jgi:hypothetical protein
MKSPLRPDSKLRVLIGIHRLWCNQCPRCNSDAPLVDSCSVCSAVHTDGGRRVLNVRGSTPYPPTIVTKALWFYMWVFTHRQKKPGNARPYDPTTFDPYHRM